MDNNICPFCKQQGARSQSSGRWLRCMNEHMWLPTDNAAVKPEARTIWRCQHCETFQGPYLALLRHRVDAHDDERARGELAGIQAIVEAVHTLLNQAGVERGNRPHPRGPITRQEVADFAAWLQSVDTLPFDEW